MLRTRILTSVVQMALLRVSDRFGTEIERDEKIIIEAKKDSEEHRSYDIWAQSLQKGKTHMDNRTKIQAAFDASGLAQSGYTPHMRAADGSMCMYSSMDNAASVRVYIDKDEVKCSVMTVLPASMIKAEIAGLSFPHPQLYKFIAQLERLTLAWKQQSGLL